MRFKKQAIQEAAAVLRVALGSAKKAPSILVLEEGWLTIKEDEVAIIQLFYGDGDLGLNLKTEDHKQPKAQLRENPNSAIEIVPRGQTLLLSAGDFRILPRSNPFLLIIVSAIQIE